MKKADPKSENPPPRRSRWRRYGLLLLSILGLGILIAVIDAVRIGALSFRKSANEAFRRTEALASRAKQFDQQTALRSLPSNPNNGFYYRFDERLDEAEVVGEAGGITRPTDARPKYGFEFEGDDIARFVDGDAPYELTDGLLRVKQNGKRFLESDAKLEIPWKDIHQVELRMKCERGKIAELRISKSETDGEDQEEGHLTTATIGDGKFHVYRIDARFAMARFNFSPEDVIRKIRIRPSNVSGDSVEIDYIRFRTKTERYAEDAFARVYEKLGGEMRQGLFFRSPLSLRYRVSISESPLQLRFAIGTLDEGSVRFRVTAEQGPRKESIFDRTLDEPQQWKDVALDFTDWPQGEIEITFSTESEGERIAFWANPTLRSAPVKRRNFIVLLEDTLRADHLSAYGYGRETTPVKDELAAQGALFVNAYSQATVTRYSCPSIMTSLYPTANGVWGHADRLHENYVTMAEAFRSQGFETAAFVQNPRAGSLSGLHQGFGTSVDWQMAGERAEDIYGPRLDRWLEENGDTNFFLYLHIIDPHYPYEPPEGFDRWSDPTDDKSSLEEALSQAEAYATLKPLYDGEIAANDAAFGKFLDRLRELELFENTCIVFLSDHGEFFGEHGLIKHSPPGYSQVVNVPLIVSYPEEISGPLRFQSPMQLIDVMPTLMEIAQIDRAPFLLQGDSFLPLIRDASVGGWDRRFVYSEEVVNRTRGDGNAWGGIFFRDWHFLYSGGKLPGKHRNRIARMLPDFLYAKTFHRGLDPAEARRIDTFAFDPLLKWGIGRKVRRIESKNREIWKNLTRGQIDEADYDQDTVDRLRNLGYLGD